MKENNTQTVKIGSAFNVFKMLTQGFLRASRCSLQIVSAVQSRLLLFRHAHNTHAHSKFLTVKTFKTILHTIKRNNGVVSLSEAYCFTY